MRNLCFLLVVFVGCLNEILGSKLCPMNISVKNGRVRQRQRGRFLRFSCNSGYLLAGEKIASCITKVGEWDTSPPRCVRPTCGKISQPANILIYPSHSGGVLNFYCHAGFILRGSNITFCDGKKWSSNLPTCIPTNSTPELSCDFEKDDICSWTHDVNHEFDWIRISHMTPSHSVNTGPSFDHTKGKGSDGHYMYLEASSKNENETARLISPVYDKTKNNTCFEFYYHMWGVTMGTLRVYLKLTSEPWDLKPSKAFFSRSGNQGNRWYRSFHELGVIAEDYQIIIEGVRGPGYHSDAAVDDVRIIENCVPEENALATTTEDTNILTETMVNYESCKNKCSEVTETCSCAADCYDNNTCCPDFEYYCIIDIGTTNVNKETSEAPTEFSEPKNKNSSEEIISDPLPRTQEKYTNNTTDKPKTQTKATTKPTEKNITFGTTKITKTTTMFRTTKTTKKTLITNPKIIILERPTTEKIVERVFTKKPVKKINNTNTNKIIFIKPTTLTQKSQPKATATSKNTATTTELSNEIPLSNEDYSYIQQENIRKHSYETFKTEEVVLKNPQNQSSSNSNRTINAISIISVLVGLTAVAVVAFKYGVFERINKRRRDFMARGHSQSDVRFLTSEEQLDFNFE